MIVEIASFSFALEIPRIRQDGMFVGCRIGAYPVAFCIIESWIVSYPYLVVIVSRSTTGMCPKLSPLD